MGTLAGPLWPWAVWFSITSIFIGSGLIAHGFVYFYIMIAFANCKINLGLFVTGKRADGYHNIESVFYPIDWTDAIEVEETKGNRGKCEIVEYGIKVGGDVKKNLCYKAYQLLNVKYALPSVRLHVHKTLPMGAGLGGGSADGSATLKLLNNYFKLGITGVELTQLAAQLGSDCPFFIENKPALVKGRGEILSPIDIDLSDFYFLLVHPGVHVSTAEAYSMIVPQETGFNLEQKISNAKPEHWKDFLRNDFEKPVFGKFPLIGGIKDKMYASGAVFSLMSGSGSAVFGIFENHDAARKAQEHFVHYTSKIILSKNHLRAFIS